MKKIMLFAVVALVGVHMHSAQKDAGSQGESKTEYSISFANNSPHTRYKRSDVPGKASSHVGSKQGSAITAHHVQKHDHHAKSATHDHESKHMHDHETSKSHAFISCGNTRVRVTSDVEKVHRDMMEQKHQMQKQEQVLQKMVGVYVAMCKDSGKQKEMLQALQGLYADMGDKVQNAMQDFTKQLEKEGKLERVLEQII